MLIRVLVSLSSVVLLAACLRAQTGVGQIQGTVSDASGAVIPNASISLEHVQAGSKLQTASSEVGFFVFPSLQTGEYRLTITALGMQKWQGQVLLQVGQSAVVTASLQVARAAEEVTVAGDVTPLVTTNSPTLATVVERQRIEQLPLNGRAIQNLLTVT